MDTATRPVRKMNGGFDFEIFCNRIPCVESPLSDTDSKIRSNPPATVQSASRSGSAARPLLRAHPPFQVPTPRRAQRGKLRVPGPAPKGRPPQSAVPLRRTNPRPGTTPQAKAAGRLVSHTPSAAPFPYLRLVPRSPSAAFVSYLRPRESNPATGKQVQSWPASPIAGRTNESKLRRFWRGSSPRSWTAPAQEAVGRKKRAKRLEASRTDGHPEANGGMERQ